MLNLRYGSLVLPRAAKPFSVPIAPMGSLGAPGPVHRLVGVIQESSRGVQGPLLIREKSGIPTYPVFWKHQAERECTIALEPESMGEVRNGQHDEALDIWKTATRLHVNLDFRLSSQPLAACLSADRTIGGRAWPSFILKEPAWERAVALWANSTLGLMSFWWAGSRQQQGRANLTISSLPSLLCLDARALTSSQLEKIDGIWEDLSQHLLLPANEAYRDEARHALDQALLVEVLGLSESVMESLSVLRKKWCAEPTVHGGKRTQIAA